MAFWDRLKAELIDIIEWTDDSSDTLVYRFERHNNEIKHGAQLIVRQGQAAVFINEGQVADVFKPGRYELQTKNVPILATLQGWKYGFESPFKAEVYFVNTRRYTDQKWGTKNPVMLRDPEFGPVRIRAFGNYAFRVSDPAKFLSEIVGTDGDFGTEEISDQLRNLIVSRFTDAVGESKIPILDLASNYDELGDFVTTKIAPEFDAYGLLITKLLVENISLPPNVEEALDKRSSMGIIGDLHKYTQYQTAEAMRAAAENPTGMAGGGMGMGMGFAMANAMGGAMMGGGQGAAPGGQPPPGPGAPPPPPPSAPQFFCFINGQQAGPFPEPQLEQLAKGGQFTPDTLVWQQGMANWTKASEVAPMQALFTRLQPPAPPPIPGNKSFFVAHNGQQDGPFPPQALQAQVEGGRLTEDTLVWTEGMAAWTPASEVEELQALFQQRPAAPPPPPPPPPG